MPIRGLAKTMQAAIGTRAKAAKTFLKKATKRGKGAAAAKLRGLKEAILAHAPFTTAWRVARSEKKQRKAIENFKILRRDLMRFGEIKSIPALSILRRIAKRRAKSGRKRQIRISQATKIPRLAAHELWQPSPPEQLRKRKGVSVFMEKYWKPAAIGAGVLGAGAVGYSIGDRDEMY